MVAGWLTLINCQMSGAVKVTKLCLIGPENSRADCFYDGRGHIRTDASLGVVVAYPDGTAIGYSEDGKCYFKYDNAAQFRQSRIMSQIWHCQCYMPVDLKRGDCSAWKAAGTETVCGLRGRLFRRTFRGDKSLMEEFVTFGNNPWGENLARTLGCQGPGGFPLRDEILQNGRVRTCRLRCTKRTLENKPDNFFLPPPGYRRVQDECMVYLGGSGLESIIYRNR